MIVTSTCHHWYRETSLNHPSSLDALSCRTSDLSVHACMFSLTQFRLKRHQRSGLPVISYCAYVFCKTPSFSCTSHLPIHYSSSHQVLSIECLVRPLPRPVSALPFTVIGLHNDRSPVRRLTPRCLFQADQVILRIPEKIRKTDPDRILSGSIYSRGFTGQTRENTFHNARQRRLKVLVLCPAN